MTITAVTVHELHEQAMDFAEEAFIGDFYRNWPEETGHRSPEVTRQLHHWAMLWEREAAQMVEIGQEPTRGILYRSAATLAVHAGQYVTARNLVEQGLAGNPPKFLVYELEEVIERIETGVWRSEVVK